MHHKDSLSILHHLCVLMFADQSTKRSGCSLKAWYPEGDEKKPEACIDMKNVHVDTSQQQLEVDHMKFIIFD